MTNIPKIAAIITIYEPSETTESLLKNIEAQVDEVIIVDNGKNKVIEGCIWLKNPENGLAKAQNMGVTKARELDCTHVLLLDDDSIPAPNMVKKLLSAHKKHPNAAVIGPYIEEEATGEPPKYISPKSEYIFKRVSFDENTPILENLYYVAASGSLIPIEIFDHIGDLKEDFFIYFIDTEFCLRARSCGFDVIAVRDAKMKHSFGESTTHGMFGKQIKTTNHSASAREYMFKNRRHLWTKYFASDAGYVLFDILRTQTEAMRVMLYEKQKTEKLQAMVKGLFSA